MKNLLPTIKYFWLTIKHKFFVFRAGLITKAPLWRLVIHDWVKFLPAELPHYGRQFFGDKSDPDGFAAAWLHHQNHCPHHWEYWMPRTGHNRSTLPHRQTGSCLVMPEWAVREMFADWMGAGRAYEGKWPKMMEWEWFEKNHMDIQLHEDTKLIVEEVYTEVMWKQYGFSRNIKRYIWSEPPPDIRKEI